MSETRDIFLYNYYDYMSSIYIYSHVKTYLIDPKRQEIENNFDKALFALSVICFAAAMFKVFVILFYFICIHALTALYYFFKTLFSLKFDINYRSSCYNAFIYLKKVVKRIFTFNFYLYQNVIINIIMIFAYIIFLFGSLFFYFSNNEHIKDTEKSEKYMNHFYLHFESILLIELLISSFYACRNMNVAVINAIVIFYALNLILYLGYLIKEQIENYEGIFEHNEPQLIMNIIFNIIFLLLNGKCLWNFLTYKSNSKYILINIFKNICYSNKL